MPKSPAELGTVRAIRSTAVPAQPFEAERYSVYIGRRYSGRCVRLSRRRYKAYDALNRLIGSFTNRAAALSAIDGGAQ